MAFKMKPKGFQMKSPNKNYKNPRDYRVFNMGNEADAPMEMHSPTDMEKTPAYMKSPVKNTGEAFAREIKEMDYEGNMPAESFKRIKNQHDKGHAQGDPHAPAKMKSGFKMKEGSPFERNFGVGSPVKLRPRYIDGVEVTDEEFAAFEEKGKDLQHKSWGAADDQYLITADNEGIAEYKEYLGDDFQTPIEFLKEKYPGATDFRVGSAGQLTYTGEDGAHVTSNLNTAGYYDYFRSKEDEFMSKAKKELEEHTGGQDWSDETDDIEKGDLRSERVRVTGQDYIDDVEKQYQEYLREASASGEKLKQRDSWMRDMGLWDGYREALNAIKTGDDGMGDVREEKTDM